MRLFAVCLSDARASIIGPYISRARTLRKHVTMPKRRFLKLSSADEDPFPSASNAPRPTPSGNAFGQAMPPRNPNMPATSGRLQIGKPGKKVGREMSCEQDGLTDSSRAGGQSSSNWAFGGGLGPGSTPTPSSQPRTAASVPSFAQTIGTSQPNTPLDLSEFPSLTSNQSSQPSHLQNAWNASSSWNSGARNQVQSTQQQQQQLPPQQEAMFPAFASQQASAESRGAPHSQLDGSLQRSKTTSNPDGFPPLGMRAGNVGGTIGEETKNGSQQHNHIKAPGHLYGAVSPSRVDSGHERPAASAIGSGMNNGGSGGGKLRFSMHL